MTRTATTLDVDYLVVGAGAAGMAFTDALIDHAEPGVRVALVDRRDGVGGHWRAAYPFVRLHQASMFYGVASTVLGGEIQQDGPEAGLHERASGPEITAYYERVLAERMVGPGRVELHAGCDYLGDRTVVARATGERFVVPDHCRVVDARYLAPRVPAETPPPFTVGDGARVVAVNDLPSLDDEPSQYVVAGSGKTATDAIVWLLTRGVDPDRVCWVRPRDPWMLNRAVVQPDPEVYLAMVAEMMRSAAVSASLDEVFGRLEDAGIMLRIDPSVTPTMAKAPTLGTWELDLLRTVGHVVRRRVRSVVRGRLELDGGSVRVADDAVVVHCAADGLRSRPRVPIWRPEAITLQPIRAGFPCFGAALAGYVEATRHDDGTKNALCPPSSFGDTLPDWAVMNVLGMRAAASFGAEPDIAAWASRVALNPARVDPAHPGSAALDAARERLAEWTAPGVARLAALAGMPTGQP
ncbi:NAD(P)-binding protein [Nocardioides plantarum]|uniref:NAD(P)-binding protein n=1 Tax=Nocardioides plantarum TaxID=29299 RepID=A0ABV5K5F0_9ACTN|nr:NAD(P)-binding protein [Nocardioides plantarum]